MTLRVLTLDDWPVWQAVRLAALADAPDAFTVSLADWHRGGEDEWRARLALPGTHNVVAFLDDRPVGVARGVPGEDEFELRSVWVAPEARGHGERPPASGLTSAQARRGTSPGPARAGGKTPGTGREPAERSEAIQHGVGDQLLDEIEAWAVRAGADALRLAVFPDNAAAVALYERHGYVPAGEAAGQTTMVKRLR